VNALAPQTLVIALGGNAILRRGEKGTIDEQDAHVDKALQHITDLVAAGHHVLVTHGNGPVVGNIVLRNEAARDTVAPMPLYVSGADSQGGIGFMLQRGLGNHLRARGLDTPVATIITQVIVDPDDPAFADPTKPIGPYYDKERARLLGQHEGWSFAEHDHGWRRVVPSPQPNRIVEMPLIAELLGSGAVVIACGGGGVPVVERDRKLEGIDAVIDKDLSAAVLARGVNADKLVILMETDRVYLDYDTPSARPIDRITVTELEALAKSDIFEKGTIGPKVEACIRFVRSTGNDALICRAEDVADALAGEAGTLVVP